MIASRARKPLIAGGLTAPIIAPPPSVASPVTQPPVTILDPADDVMPVGPIGTGAPVNERPSWSEGPAGLYKPGVGGILQKLGDAINEPGMKAALFRSGAATIQGGLGAGLQAGAGYMDQRHATEAAAERQAVNDAFETRKLDQGDTQMANALGINLADLQERRASRVGSQALTQRDQDIRATQGNADRAQRETDSQRDFFIKKYGIDVGENSATADRQLKAAGIQTDSADRRYIAETEAKSRLAVAGTVRPAGVGSKAGKPSAKLSAQAEVLPADATADDLEVNKIYRTPRGLGQWDGAKFVPVQ